MSRVTGEVEVVRIGQLAEKTGVSVRALRYYEQQSLLYAVRSTSGQRHYPDAAVDRVHLIQQLYAAGLSSKTILDLLPCVDSGISTPESKARLIAERDRINGQLAALTATRDRLDTVIAATGDEGVPCGATASTHAHRPDPDAVQRDVA